MKHIKKFESFSKDGVDVDHQEYPSVNVAIQQSAKNYVETTFAGGSNSDVAAICKEIGIKPPKDDQELESVKEMAVDYFIKNPERMKSTSSVRSMPVKSSVVPTTNNVGGALHEANKPEPNKKGTAKVDITDEERGMFRTESVLMNLIRNNKVNLQKNEVWYNTDDEKTVKTLDIFFEINTNEK